MGYHSTPTRMTINKKTTLIMVVEDVEKLEPSNTAGGNVNCGHFGSLAVPQFLEFHQKKVNYENFKNLM